MKRVKRRHRLLKNETNFISSKKNIIHHMKTLTYVALFLSGSFLGMVTLGLSLPEDMSNLLFESQDKVIDLNNVDLSNKIQGNFISKKILGIIFSNNLKVFILSLAISCLFGTGALFVLTWNTSVLAYLVVSSFNLHVIPRYFFHAPLEIFAFMLAGLIGGLFNFGQKQDKQFFLDVIDLSLIAVSILFVAAIIEVFLVPLI